jgi:hypothetical protein
MIVHARKPRPQQLPTSGSRSTRDRGNVPTIVRPPAVSIDRDELARRAAAADKVWRDLIAAVERDTKREPR